MKYSMRTTSPSTSNKHYIKTTHGGLNECILISGNSCLPNCVGYAWGRRYETEGSRPKLSRGNAENWWNYNDGYKRGSTPKLGAVICWRKGKAGNANDGAGHVAIVEKVKSNGDILTSNSGYGGSRFWMQTFKKSNNYYLGKNYTFQGFIYSPIEWETDVKPESKPSTSLKYSKGDKIILNGYLYKDSMGNGRGVKKTNYKGTIKLINNEGTKPYHIDSLGWVAESDIKLQSSGSSVTYYPKCSSKYTSIVDGLRSIGVDSSYSNRSKIAKVNSISGYAGTASQNTKMLNLLKQGKLIKSK